MVNAEANLEIYTCSTFLSFACPKIISTNHECFITEPTEYVLLVQLPTTRLKISTNLLDGLQLHLVQSFMVPQIYPFGDLRNSSRSMTDGICGFELNILI